MQTMHTTGTGTSASTHHSAFHLHPSLLVHLAHLAHLAGTGSVAVRLRQLGEETVLFELNELQVVLELFLHLGRIRIYQNFLKPL